VGDGFTLPLAFDGSLNAYGGLVRLRLPQNPARPAIDGFGTPTDWVPPYDAQLFNAPNGQDAVSFYLQSASDAAAQATTAVKEAFDALLQQETDAAVAQAAHDKDAALTSIEQQALCGGNNATCDTRTATVTLGASDFWAYAGKGSPPNCSGMLDVGGQLDCLTYAILDKLRVSVSLGQAVVDNKNAVSSPTFDAYGGGTLQGTFISQWSALRSLFDLAKQVVAASDAAKQKVVAADSAANAASSVAADNCGARAYGLAALAGVSVGASVGFPSGVSVSVSFSPGPIIAQDQKCRDLTNNVDPAIQQKILAGFDAISALMSQFSQATAAVKTLVQASADGQRAIQDARLATARDLLESKLQLAGQTTSFGLYRRYHSYDVFRAQALLENARRQAVAARRAIEARYVVDLSKMTADEPFVASPASWSDEVFAYDLNMPAAVGLSVGVASGSGIYPNQILDYVGNLQNFAKGYAVARPTAVASGDTEVLTFAGPTLLGNQGFDPRSGSWAFYCPGGASCLPNANAGWCTLNLDGSSPCMSDTDCAGTPTPVCGPRGACVQSVASACAPLTTAPTAARLAFMLDAWGRVDGDYALPPFQQRFNARWTQLAVNLVGTGLLDCAAAADPTICYNSPFIRYNMTHSGPSWIDSYDQSWRFLSIPVGEIEGAKALAAEQWLDAISNSWSKPYVNSVARQEFTQRPFDGMYSLELQLGPESRLDRLESVQILTNTTYWVKQ
jgi:hypothetical protein